MKYGKILTYSLLSVFIIIVIVGLTYGYTSSNIHGNTNSQDTVIVDLKTSSIEFRDLSETNINKLIEPGFTDIKIFTIKNIGNVSVTYNIYLGDVENNFARPQDLQYTLYRKAGNNTININNLNDNDIISTGQYPTHDEYIKMKETLTNQNDIYTYAFKVEYMDSVENQDSNKGKVFSSKIQIDGEIDKTKMPPQNLADTIIANAQNITTEEKALHYAEYRETPYTTPAAQVNSANEGTLSKTTDDYGDSYYFRGNIINNYVDFANMCWKIVRIVGDGSIRLILEDQDTKCENMDYNNGDGNWNIPLTTGGSTKTGHFGYNANLYSGRNIESYNNPVSKSNQAQITAYNNFQNGVLSSYLGKLQSGKWCYNTKAYTTTTGGTLIQDRSTYYTNGTAFYYDSYVRLLGKSTKEPTLLCDGEVMDKFFNNDDMYVGALTADELVYSGFRVNASNSNTNYMINKWQTDTTSRFLTMSLYRFNNNNDYGIVLAYDGSITSYAVTNNTRSLRPAINLIPNIETSYGDGTQTNPYVIKNNSFL